MKLNLEDRHIFETTMTVQQVRDFFDGMDLPEVVTTALDEAQGHVHSKESPTAYVVIEIT